MGSSVVILFVQFQCDRVVQGVVRISSQGKLMLSCKEMSSTVFFFVHSSQLGFAFVSLTQMIVEPFFSSIFRAQLLLMFVTILICLLSIVGSP